MPGRDQTIPVDEHNLLLRGCILKNVHEVVGVCMFTGKDTKLVLNSVEFAPKRSKLMAEINKLVIEIFIWQVMIAMICALFNLLLENSYTQIIQWVGSSTYWITAFTWWLLMTYFIPISLMVTMEMVKLFQGSALDHDPKGWSDAYQCYTTANNTSVNENLGQIKYVFTDKTGTLTKNNMVFKKIIIGGELYGENDEPVDEDADMRQSVHFRDSRFRQRKESPRMAEAIRLICLCHDIYVEKEGDKLNYNSSSPD